MIVSLLSEIDFKIKHIKGKQNKVVDVLRWKINQINATSTSNYQTDLEHRIILATENYEFYKDKRNAKQQCKFNKFLI